MAKQAKKTTKKVVKESVEETVEEPVKEKEIVEAVKLDRADIVKVKQEVKLSKEEKEDPPQAV